jgi:hypothetical protein
MQVVQRRHYAIVRPMPAVPSNYVIGDCSELGFSLKPPKFIRKLTIKKVLKPLAIAAAVGASLFIPGVAPVALAIGKGALSAGRFVGGGILAAGRGVGKGVVSAEKGIMNLFHPKASAADQAAADQAERDRIAAAMMNQGGGGGPTPSPAQSTASMPDMNLPSPYQAASGGQSGGGGSSAPTGAPSSADTPGGSAADAGVDTGGEPVPTKPGFNPMVVVGVGLLGLALASQAGSRKR